MGKVIPFLKCETFFEMPGQNTIKVIKKRLMTKTVRIKAWQEEGDSATVADRLDS